MTRSERAVSLSAVSCSTLPLTACSSCTTTKLQRELAIQFWDTSESSRLSRAVDASTIELLSDHVEKKIRAVVVLSGHRMRMTQDLTSLQYVSAPV